MKNEPVPKIGFYVSVCVADLPKSYIKVFSLHAAFENVCHKLCLLCFVKANLVKSGENFQEKKRRQLRSQLEIGGFFLSFPDFVLVLCVLSSTFEDELNQI